MTLSSQGGTGIAINGETVFFAAASGIFAVPVSGGSTTTLYVKQDPLELPVKIGTTSNNIYWTDNGVGALFRLPLQGAQAPQLELNIQGASGLNAAASSVECSGFGGEIARRDEGGGTTVWTVAGAELYHLTSDASSLYVADIGGPPGPHQRILKISKDTGNVEELAVEQTNPGMIVVDNSNVYWGIGDNSGGEVRTAGKDGGPARTLTRVPLGVDALALADGSLYFATVGRSPTTANTAALYRFNLETGSRTTLATNLSFPLDLVAWKGEVFWVENKRVAKWSAQ